MLNLEDVKFKIDIFLCSFYQHKMLAVSDITSGCFVYQCQRRSNEDRYQIKQVGPFQYYAVFDGHGCKFPDEKQENVHVANYCQDNLHVRLATTLCEDKLDDTNYVTETIKNIFVDFDKEMLAKNLQYGSCCTIVLLDKNRKRLYQINLGDSRSYVIDTSIDMGEYGDVTFTVTEDHNCRSQVEIDRITKAGSTVFYGRVNGDLAVSCAFGDFNFKFNNKERDHIEGAVSALPVVKVLDIKENDIVILTSDAPFENTTSEKFMYNFRLLHVAHDGDLARVIKMLGISIRTSDDTTIIIVNPK